MTTYWCPRMATESNRGWFTAAIARGVGFLVLWLALAGFDIGDLPAAVVAVVGATLASLRLLPPSAGHAFAARRCQRSCCASRSRRLPQVSMSPDARWIHGCRCALAS